MAYTVLARRYRSQSFDDVVGQDAIARTLTNAIKTGRVAHAYLFSGTRGVGKTTMARILAKSLNCLNFDEPTLTPCCECESCKAINNGEDIDVIEIDGASNNGVDNIRELRQNAIYRPARSRFKIYIIDEIHMLSTGAFNALLKILEEPPEHVKFIFATTEPNKVLPTIQSRCQRFDFKAIDPQNIRKQLNSVLGTEGIGIEDDAVTALARLANGSMRDSLSLLDQVISMGVDPITVEVVEEAVGQPGRSKINMLLEKIADSDAAGVLEVVDKLIFEGMSCIQVVDGLIECVRDLMVIKAGGVGSGIVILTPAEKEFATRLATKFDIASLVYNITTLEKMRWTIKNADNPRALTEAAMVRMALSEHFINVTDLMKRIASGQMPVKKNFPQAAVGNNAPAAGSNASPAAVARPTPNSNQQPQAASRRRSARSAGAEEEPLQKFPCQSVEDVKVKWAAIVGQISKRAPMIGATITPCVPYSFDGSVVTLAFAKSMQMAKKLCESDGRDVKISGLLSEILGANVTVKYVVSDKTDAPERRKPKGAGTSRRELDDLKQDPGVKTLLDGLRARVLKIEEGR